MKKTRCGAEDCRETAAFFYVTRIVIIGKSAAAGQRVVMQVPLCRLHAMLFDVAQNFIESDFSVIQMKEIPV